MSAKSKRPDIPKRLAARIRGAQERVRQKRLDIVYSEQNYRQISSRVAEFDTDPDSFARRYYGKNGVDSYPVQTSISRNRDSMLRHEQRHDERLRELADLELELLRVEQEVLVEVTRMRPTTGRVPWPRRLPPFKSFQQEFEAHVERQHERWREQRAQDDAEFERLIAAEEARLEEQSRIEDDLFRQELSKMSPEEYAKYRAWADYLTAGLRSGELTMPDIIAALEKKN